MGMEINNAYNNYASAYAIEQSVRQSNSAKSAGASAKPTVVKDTGVTKQVQSTQDYLKSLQDKYPDVNITVGKNTTAKSFKGYMLGSSGTNNIYIEDNILDKMAKDPSYAAKYEKVIADAPKAGQEIKNAMESKGTDQCLGCGTQIDKNGKVSYWCVGVYTGPQVRMGTELREKAQKALEEKRVERSRQEKMGAKKAEAKKSQEAYENKRAEKKADEQERKKMLLSQADSVDELLTKINTEDGRVVFNEELVGIEAGKRLNLSV